MVYVIDLMEKEAGLAVILPEGMGRSSGWYINSTWSMSSSEKYWYPSGRERSAWRLSLRRTEPSMMGRSFGRSTSWETGSGASAS
jgi:hypothetical protein